MDQATIAESRFGLGGMGSALPMADPKSWLKSQLQDFDPRPSEIAALPHSDQLILMLRESRDNQKLYKEEQAKLEGSPEADLLPRPFRGLRDEYVKAVGVRTSVALASATPFVERLVHFWSNHFAVSIDKLVTLGLAGAFEFEAIRPNVLGKFSDLLLAVESHPGMLLYLDQAQSVGPNSQLGKAAGRRGRERGLNENLAREVLELHTLGVRTGYSQGDVTELARALTGWTVAGLAQQGRLRGNEPGFVFVEAVHEPGTKVLLGKRYDQAGASQAKTMLEELARHPATARHLATKLARHFAGDTPPSALVTRLEQTYLKTEGDLPALYQVLIDAPQVWAGSAKFRTPWDWMTATLRAIGVKTLPGKLAANALQQLGQPVWKPGSPAGYDDSAASWAGPDALVRRVEAAQRLAQRASGGIDARQLAGRLFGSALSRSTASAIERAESGEQALALLLAAPEMMRR